MPRGHPHASWEHVGALGPVGPASDDAAAICEPESRQGWLAWTKAQSREKSMR